MENHMTVEIPLDNMSVAEKVRLLESVWDSLCAKSGDVQSPEWHREVLETRKRRLEDGQATASPWSEAKDRLLDLGR
jgi:putative addiction module component (TIGR02574 family)